MADSSTRFARSYLIVDSGLRSDVWGGDKVKPRNVDNGLEDPKWSYWCMEVFPSGGKEHMFAVRWPESSPKGGLIQEGLPGFLRLRDFARAGAAQRAELQRIIVASEATALKPPLKLFASS